MAANFEEVLEELMLHSKYPAGGAIHRIYQTGGVKFKPSLHENVTYIVAAVLFNEEGQILLTQEGFHPCRGQWYLPAGRVDPNESLCEAAYREVKEETGLEFEPSTVLAVETPRPNWYRFTFTGHVTGGRLRGLDLQDSETLQAAWWDVEKVRNAKYKDIQSALKEFVLRGRDILPLIDIAHQYRQSLEGARHPKLLPQIVNHSSMLVRVVCLFNNTNNSSDNQYLLTINQDAEKALPVVEFSPQITTIVGAAYNLLQEALGAEKSQKVQIDGVLEIEHCGRPHGQYDGLCLTVMTSLTLSKCSPPSIKASAFNWHLVRRAELQYQLKERTTRRQLVLLLYR